MLLVDRPCSADRGAGAVRMRSFRDPGGNLVEMDGRILRVVNERGLRDLTFFLSSRLHKRLIKEGKIVLTKMLEPERVPGPLRPVSGQIVVEHERVRFPSFPYEWPPEMLHAAGLLTIELAMELLDEGMGLKDATPYNVLFKGPRPVFVDLLSFERRQPGDPTWLAYAQFVRTFLLPLLANKQFGLALEQTLVNRRDGLEPEQLYRWTGPFRRLAPSFLSLVSMPKWLARRGDARASQIYRKKETGDAHKTRFILRSLFGRLQRALVRMEPAAGRHSPWSEYRNSEQSYSPAQLRVKDDFVRLALKECSPRTVLDVGANTGYYSTMAARGGAGVVAVDSDPVVAGKLWRTARAEGLDILPLAVDLTRPTPATGWLNRECPSFLDRAHGAFDVVLMLAVVHHMLVGEGTPLSDVLDLAAELTRDALVIEYVGPEDPMFRWLARGRDELHRYLTPAVFEAACRKRFAQIRWRQIEGSDRRLYLMHKVH